MNITKPVLLLLLIASRAADDVTDGVLAPVFSDVVPPTKRLNAKDATKVTNMKQLEEPHEPANPPETKAEALPRDGTEDTGTEDLNLNAIVSGPTPTAGSDRVNHPEAFGISSSELEGSTPVEAVIVAPKSTIEEVRNLKGGCWGETNPNPAWHPVWSAGWPLGHCTYRIDCDSSSYLSELACCKFAYPGQLS
eukprot:CAMPEP_0172321410 /NCGR_PEP_ID=MMETSP1058-20130122/43301_1 /TAXON_ID=83371 /ORGANISM="Detonula confervacea, Strain CCMP 353" /LENGTH=192 /DNA_ID=CAMNT_0013036913 /DNA_START=129 /DNA_END=704 /DNA_ORIENTATION=+